MISEERLRTAARAVSQAMIDSLPEPEDCHHDFSPEFERKMKKLLRRSRHWGLYQGMKRAACFFLVLLLSGGIFLTVNAEAREIVFGWISERLDEDYHYFHQGRDKVSPEDVRYVLPEIPAGYKPYDLYDDGKGFVSLCYANEAGRGFSFEYMIGEDAGDMYLLTGEEGERRMVTVNGKPAEFYPSTGEDVSSTLVWQDTETGALLYISGFFEEEYLIQLAESVVREEK